MTLLRILRNLAVLVILTLGGLSLAQGSVVPQSSCKLLGAFCTSSGQCCQRYCGPYHNCCVPFHNRACIRDADCCSYKCQGYRCL